MKKYKLILAKDQEQKALMYGDDNRERLGGEYGELDSDGNQRYIWVENTPPLADRKEDKWAAVKTERDRREAAGFAYLGKTFDSDPTSALRLTVAASAARASLDGGQTGLTFDWTLQDNTVLTMTAEEFIALPLALADSANTLHQHARHIRAQIEAATTGAEIDALPDW